MSNYCKHHWHLTTEHDHSGGAIITSKRCHCGQVQTEHLPPRNDAIWTSDSSGCGPFGDRPRFA